LWIEDRERLLGEALPKRAHRYFGCAGTVCMTAHAIYDHQEQCFGVRN